jgi:lysozyme
MNRHVVETQLKTDEGVRHTVYRDTLGNLTVGIGHLILPSDNIPEGSTISVERVADLFQHDLDTAIAGASMVFPAFVMLPEALQECIVNMLFNLGMTRFCTFKKFIAAVNIGDYWEAANQLRDSKWYQQVGPRAQRIVATVQGLAGDVQNV